MRIGACTRVEDVPAFPAGVDGAEGDGRGPLGRRGEDHRPYFRALRDIGCDGRGSIEARWDGGLPERLAAAVAELRRQIDSA